MLENGGTRTLRQGIVQFIPSKAVTILIQLVAIHGILEAAPYLSME